MRTAIVTGGASGIGRSIATRLRADGHPVAILDLAATEDPHGYVADVTDYVQVYKAFACVEEELGVPSILINAAGLEGYKRFGNIDFDLWSHVVNVNLHGVFHTVQAALPGMLGQRWGRIVNISSSSTHSGVAHMAHYVAAKSAVNGLTKSLALEYGPFGVTVNAVTPGFIDTPMLRKAESKGLLGGPVEDIIERTPVRRVGRPEDIAAACSFLISEDAGYITGQILGVNGGRNT